MKNCYNPVYYKQLSQKMDPNSTGVVVRDRIRCKKQISDSIAI